ncbi:MAG: glycosyltransferase [Rhodospirillales bacterium]
MTERILFYCQHLLGIGHLRRAVTLARGLSNGGFDVTLVSGGEAVPNLELHGLKFEQLDPVRAVDKFFKVLVDSNGTVIDDAFKARRCQSLLALFARLKPDLVLTEMFPFGRRQLRFELLPLLDAAKQAKMKVASSVRDILVSAPKPERLEEMIGLIETYYDVVLVHSDPRLIPFDRTFPPAQRFADRLRYTGYVVEGSTPDRSANAPGKGEVLVSAGGGAVSEPLLEAAIAAKPNTALADARWRLLVGHNLPDQRFAALQAKADANSVVERARPDFTTLLANAALSISQGGYNTVMETIKFGHRAVISPYAGGLETEQTLRAALLAERGLIHIVDETTLSAATLADAIARALAAPPIDAAALFNLDGLNTTVQIVRDLLR